MTFDEKLMNLRKSRGWSQEELGERLGVTRQTVSKWELGETTPEMEKLARMSELFGVSIDELVKGGDYNETYNETKSEQFPSAEKKSRFVNGEYKSQRSICGMPLVHISRRTAKGFIAIGVRARGIISIGVLSVGVVSIGVLAFGLIAIGTFALGAAAHGAIAAGFLAMGGVSVGVFSFGGASFGWLSFGGASIGKYAFGGYASGDIAVGGTAKGIIALGDKASGEITFDGAVSAEEFRAAIEQRLPSTPKFIADMFSWLAENVTINGT